MKAVAFSLIFFLGTMIHLCAESISEGTVISPKKSFSITQTRNEEGIVSTLTFRGSGKTFVLQPSPISWRGFYTISADERWILRIQKIGSGDNNIWIYEVKNGEILPEQEVGQDAWEFHEKVTPYKNIPLYHTGFDFVRWDNKATIVLTMHGTSDDQVESHHVKGFVVKYDLSSKTFTKGQRIVPAIARRRGPGT